jgi:lipopolysaccharide/colanic/teichoic acid biosynthesis glycosyltransferase
MRVPLPTSYGSLSIRLSFFDVVCALLSPGVALWVRGAQVLTNDPAAAALYCLISFFCSLIAFQIFRIREGLTHLFSVHDAIKVAQAVLASELMSCLVLFSLTRLEGVPRSTPLIHALILLSSLVIARAFVRMGHSETVTVAPSNGGITEHIIVIGSNKLSSLYIDLLRAYAPDRYRVCAVLDDRQKMVGRSVAGVRVLAPTENLLPVMQEFKEHGIEINRIVVGGDEGFLTSEAMANVEEICGQYQVKLDFIPQLIGLNRLRAPIVQEPKAADTTQISISRYFLVKRYIDFCLSLVFLVFLMPVLLLVAIVVLLDVGSPVFYWQRRMGMNLQVFQMHKFRTLRPAYDWRGQAVGPTARISPIGAVLRKFRLDELPQLLNVLVGDMSLIGPRPLLPHDQPPDPTLRLMVRPGITGWAQVNGGTLLSVDEKNACDEWYIRNASLWLDLKIVGKTALFLVTGERSRVKPRFQFGTGRPTGRTVREQLGPSFRARLAVRSKLTVMPSSLEASSEHLDRNEQL